MRGQLSFDRTWTKDDQISNSFHYFGKPDGDLNPMQVEFTLKMLPDIMAMAALIMLSFYHLLIYLARKRDADEQYNLYFSIFVFVAMLFIVAPYFRPGALLAPFKPAWLLVTNIEALLAWGLFFSGLKFLNVLMKTPATYRRYFYFTYVTIGFNFLLTLTGNFISSQFYFKNILPIVLAIAALNLVLNYATYARWIYIQKLYRLYFFMVLYIGFVLMTLNILVYRSIELLNMPGAMFYNHYITVMMLYVFAYALSVKFNTEYFELKELKVSLEQKVLARTEDLHRANELLEEKNSEIEKQKEEISAINDQLAQRADELESLDETKSRFFAGISHEFRTPLTLIIGPIESLLSKTNDAKLRSDYGMMLRQAQRLLELINQLLDLSKLQKGMMELNLERRNFNRFVRTIVSAYHSMADDLGVELSFVEECPEQSASFDKDKVEKIVTNLVANALKFTPRQGSVAVLVNCSKDPGFMEILVRDTGVGISAENLSRIFNPFYQVDSERRQSFQGSGIGLALTKELVDLHDGSISVKSELNKGTVFTVKLWVENRVSSAPDGHEDGSVMVKEITMAKSSRDPIVEPSEGKQTILLVEDNVDMRHFITSNLPVEYNILEAENGEDGLAMALEHSPDLIITDIMMPVMNGLELTAKLKQDERISHVPVIMLTAKASMDSKVEGLNTKADDYITKPFNVMELTLRIENLIRSRQLWKEKFSRSIVVNPAEITATSLDERFLQSALQVVERNMDESEFNAELFCDEVGMSRAHVHRKLKALTGQSTTEFIRVIRLKRAAQLLKQNSGSVSEIAYQTGFNNLSYFTRCFKEEFSVLPSEYAEK